VVDANGREMQDAQVTVQAFANARAADVQSVPLVARPGGHYQAELLRPRLGLWELRVQVESGELFTQVLRNELIPAAIGAGPS
jgi:nitrogen fixation protein FixH